MHAPKRCDGRQTVTGLQQMGQGAAQPAGLAQQARQQHDEQAAQAQRTAHASSDASLRTHASAIRNGYSSLHACARLHRTLMHCILKLMPFCHAQDGDPEGWWEESFNGHKDTKPSGPEAISIDLAFPGSQHVYGIPERATNLALKPTAGRCCSAAEGCCMPGHAACMLLCSPCGASQSAPCRAATLTLSSLTHSLSHSFLHTGAGVTSEPYRLYNLDVFEYEHASPFGLYGAIPVLLAHKVGLTTGVFW